MHDGDSTNNTVMMCSRFVKMLHPSASDSIRDELVAGEDMFFNESVAIAALPCVFHHSVIFVHGCASHATHDHAVVYRCCVSPLLQMPTFVNTTATSRGMLDTLCAASFNSSEPT